MVTILCLSLVTLSAPAALVAEKSSIDLGEVNAGPLLTRSFTVRNGTGDIVHIVSLDSTCGCLRRSIAKMQLAAGESTEVSVTINTLTQPAGPQTWRTSVRYRTADDAVHSLELQLTAKLRREITLSPPMLAISTTRSAKAELTLVDTRAAPFQIRHVEATHPSIQVAVASENSGTTRLTVAVSESLPDGTHDHFVVLTTSDPQYAELRVPVRIVKQPADAITATPSALQLDRTSGGVGLVQLRRADRQSLTVESATCEAPGIRITWADGPAATLRVMIDPKTAAPSGQADVRVKTGQGVVTIPLRWEWD